jgi:hypothetical protein
VLVGAQNEEKVNILTGCCADSVARLDNLNEDYDFNTDNEDLGRSWGHVWTRAESPKYVSKVTAVGWQCTYVVSTTVAVVVAVE